MSLKTFTLTSAIERSNLCGAKNNFKISCIEACGKNLYLGTDVGVVLHYSVSERPGGGHHPQSSRLECSSQGHATLEAQKPVVQIEANVGLKRILALCDSSVIMVNMLNMQLLPGFKIKLANVFAVNEKPTRGDPFSVEVCVGTRKKSIQIISIRDDQFFLLREFQLDSLPMALRASGSFMCVGLPGEYKMIRCDVGTQQDLFRFDSRQVLPVVVHISQNEYLLSASNALGIFALSDGVSMRPPLQWINNIISVSYSHPYVVVLNDEFMTIHSVLDQQQKQTIQFNDGISTSESNGRIFVATNHDVYCLVPEPIDKQIQSLLSEKRITEALELTKNIDEEIKASLNLGEMTERIELQAGFVEFRDTNFDAAVVHFNNGRLDVRELISLYPDLLPENSTFVRTQPPLHAIVDIRQLSEGRVEIVEIYEKFLFHHLRGLLPRVDRELKSDVMTAHLKLLGKFHQSRLIDSLPKYRDFIDVGSCAEYFRNHGNLHCCSVLLFQEGNEDAALDTWMRLCGGEAEDASFPGIDYVVDVLCKSENADLTWKHADWFMEKDQQLAVKMFIKQSERLGVDKVIEYLEKYREAKVSFVEDLVFEKKSKEEKYNTMLASLYLDEVLSTKGKDVSPKSREKLQNFLKSSGVYSASSLLARVEGTDLHHERALLHGKLEDHGTALNILAEKVQNFEAAEEYCATYSTGRSSEYRMRLFETLLSIYLNARNFKEQYLIPTLALLNRHQHEFDAIKVIQAVPDSWSSEVIGNFLSDSLRGSLHRRRMSFVLSQLARGTNSRTKLESFHSTRAPVVMSEERVCFLCSRPFTDPVFVSLPKNDLVAHVHCQQNLL